MCSFGSSLSQHNNNNNNNNIHILYYNNYISYHPITRMLGVIEYETEAELRSSNSIRLTSESPIDMVSGLGFYSTCNYETYVHGTAAKKLVKMEFGSVNGENPDMFTEKNCPKKDKCTKWLMKSFTDWREAHNL